MVEKIEFMVAAQVSEALYAALRNAEFYHASEVAAPCHCGLCRDAAAACDLYEKAVGMPEDQTLSHARTQRSWKRKLTEEESIRRTHESRAAADKRRKKLGLSEVEYLQLLMREHTIAEEPEEIE